MLGNFLNEMDASSLDRFYLAGIAGYFPVERNAFDVQRRRCQLRQLRLVAQTLNPLLVVDMNGDNVSRDGVTTGAYAPRSADDFDIQDVLRFAKVSPSTASNDVDESDVSDNVVSIFSKSTQKQNQEISHGQPISGVANFGRRLTWNAHYLRGSDERKAS